MVISYVEDIIWPSICGTSALLTNTQALDLSVEDIFQKENLKMFNQIIPPKWKNSSRQPSLW
jgi:hypothetical protein